MSRFEEMPRAAKVALVVVGIVLAIYAVIFVLQRATDTADAQAPPTSEALMIEAHSLWKEGNNTEARALLAQVPRSILFSTVTVADEREGFGGPDDGRPVLHRDDPILRPSVQDYDIARPGYRLVSNTLKTEQSVVGWDIFRTSFGKNWHFNGNRVLDFQFNVVGHVTDWGRFLGWNKLGEIDKDHRWEYNQYVHSSFGGMRYRACIPSPLGGGFACNTQTHKGYYRVTGNGSWRWNPMEHW